MPEAKETEKAYSHQQTKSLIRRSEYPATPPSACRSFSAGSPLYKNMLDELYDKTDIVSIKKESCGFPFLS